MTVDLSSTSSQAVHADLDLTLSDASGVENVIGSAFADNLTGNTLDNVLEGGVGDDTLAGGTGNDTYDFARHRRAKAR